MRQRQSFLLVSVLVTFISVYVGRDSLASFAWQKYRLPQVAVFLDGSNAELAMFIGNYYFNSVIGGGEYNLGIAKKAFEKAVSINPEILWGHYQLARIYFVEGDYGLALEEIAKELEANPENLRALYIRGLIYGYRNWVGDLAKAEADFRQFTKWAPSEWAGYNDLAWILSKAGKYSEAKVVINDVLNKVADARDNPWLWNAKGVAELNLREYAIAANSFRRALDLADTLTEADWRQSYPGNNPESAGLGLEAFKEAIRSNIDRAKSF